jgi:hypothetical protein
MSSRLIPWCLAATGFVAALTVFGWQGELGGADQRMPLHAAAGHSPTAPATDHSESRSSQLPAASEAPESVPETRILPLPPATPPEPDPNVQPVVDDAPTVEDLPARRSESASPEDQ